MDSSASSKVLKDTVKRTQKNGDIYVYEREKWYDREKKYYRALHYRLLYKIPKGNTEPTPTRPKRQSTQQKENTEQAIFGNRQKQIDATCKRTGLTDILQHVGKAAGIDAAVMRSLKETDALMALSVARYLVATNGATLPEIEEWQLRHTLPYHDGITEENYHSLFVNLGHDEAARQSLFFHLSKNIASDGIFYDSTTVSTYSENLTEARYGFNKDHDGLPTFKILTFFSRKERRPLAFSLQPGNIPDQISLSNAVKELDFLHIDRYIVVTDNGFCSENSLTAYVRSNTKYLTLIAQDRQWIRPLVKNALPELETFTTLNMQDVDIHQYATSVFHEFTWSRKRGRGDKVKGDVESIKRRVYVHVFRSDSRTRNASDAFRDELLRLKKRIESGEELTQADEKRRDTFFNVTSVRGGIRCAFNEESCRRALQAKGIFVLVSNAIKDSTEALILYRTREWIEEFFRTMKNMTDGAKPRVWSYEGFKGRVTVQFIALCYYSWLYNAISAMKGSLGKENGDPKHDLKETLKAEKRLLSWLENKSLHQILLWFDAIETTRVRHNGKVHSWTTEITTRDRLFLEKLGMRIV